MPGEARDRGLDTLVFLRQLARIGKIAGGQAEFSFEKVGHQIFLENEDLLFTSNAAECRHYAWALVARVMLRVMESWLPEPEGSDLAEGASTTNQDGEMAGRVDVRLELSYRKLVIDKRIAAAR